MAAKRAKQASELQGLFGLLDEVGQLADTMEEQAHDTSRMMRVSGRAGGRAGGCGWVVAASQCGAALAEARKRGALHLDACVLPSLITDCASRYLGRCAWHGVQWLVGYDL